MAVTSALTPSSDALYLRRLLERQPACLIRVRLDGVLLACNDAALGLLGVGAPRAVLNTNLTDRIVPAQRPKWQEFATRCWANGAASLECGFVIGDDDARPVLVQGVALKDHPNGVESLLLHLRDQSQTHRLEHSIQSADNDRVGNEERQRVARDQVEEATVERLKLAVLAEQGEAERRRLTEALEAQTADRQRRQAICVELEKRVEESQLVLLEREREHRDGVAALKTALAAAQAAQITAVAGDDDQVLEAVTLRLQAATAEQARLAALVAEYEIDRQRVAASHDATADTLEQSLARAGKEAALGGEQSRQAMAELRSQLLQVLAEQSRMAARAEEHERERDLMRADHHRALADLETSKGEALADLRSQLQQSSAEQGRLATRIEERELERDRLIAEHHQALGDVETSKHEALAELRSQLEQSSTEQGRLAARVEGPERERDLIRAEHHRALADLETGKGMVAELRWQLSQASAEQGRLATLIEAHELARDRLIAKHHHALGDVETSKCEALAELRSQLEQSSAEQGRLAARVEEHEAARAEHHHALGDVETSKREALAELQSQLSQALADLETGMRVVADLRRQFSQASAEQGHLAARVQEHELAHDRLIAEHHRTLDDMETSKREALAEAWSQLEQSSAEQSRLAARVEEHERERDSVIAGVIADHHRALADVETSKREALAELRSQLSQAFADQRRWSARVEEHERERDSVIADHHRALAEMETGKSEALGELRSQLSQAFADQRRLAARVDDQELERDRLRAEHHRALADLENRKREALAESRSQLSQAVAEHSRLTAFLEEHDRERERMGAEHRRAITDLQVSKREAVFECERVLTEVQHALLVRDGARLLEIERRLIDEMDECARTNADGERSASLIQGGLTQAFSDVQAVLKTEEALTEPFEAEHNELERPTIETIDKASVDKTAVDNAAVDKAAVDKAAAEAADRERLSDEQVGPRQAVSEMQSLMIDVDPMPELFDDADNAFVRHLLEGNGEPPLLERRTDPAAGSAQPVSGMKNMTAGDRPEPDVFDAQDDAFVLGLMKSGPTREPADQTDAEPLQELSEKKPSPPEGS